MRNNQKLEYPDFELKVKVKKVPTCLKSRINVGNVGIMYTPRYQEDTIIVRETKRLNKETGKWVIVNPATIAKAGTIKHNWFYANWYLKLNKNGDTIPGMLFEPFSAPDCFDKVEEKKKKK